MTGPTILITLGMAAVALAGNPNPQDAKLVEKARGSWNAETGRATYRVTPDKEPPFWNPYSQVIYWLTATEVDAERAYRIAFNGYVVSVPKKSGPAYIACRCVKAP